VDPYGRQQQGQGNHDERNTHSMAKPIKWMLMTVAILTDPLIPTLSAEHNAS
jgi:hypothetical protein